MTFCVGEDLLMVSRSWLKTWRPLEKALPDCLLEVIVYFRHAVSFYRRNLNSMVSGFHNKEYNLVSKNKKFMDMHW